MDDRVEYCATAQSFDDLLKKSFASFSGKANFTAQESYKIRRTFYDTARLDLWKNQTTLAFIEKGDQGGYQADTHYEDRSNRSVNIPTDEKHMSSDDLMRDFRIEKDILNGAIAPVFTAESIRQKSFIELETPQGEKALLMAEFDRSDISLSFMPRNKTASHTLSLEHISGSMAGFDHFKEALCASLEEAMNQEPFAWSPAEAGFSSCEKLLNPDPRSSIYKISCPD